MISVETQCSLVKAYKIISDQEEFTLIYKSFDRLEILQSIYNTNDFSQLLHQSLVDNRKRNYRIFIALGQQENVNKAEVLSGLESIMVMTCKPIQFKALQLTHLLYKALYFYYSIFIDLFSQGQCFQTAASDILDNKSSKN